MVEVCPLASISIHMYAVAHAHPQYTNEYIKIQKLGMVLHAFNLSIPEAEGAADQPLKFKASLVYIMSSRSASSTQ